MKLHELHHRRLESTARLVENSMNRMESLLRERGESGIAGAVTNTLSEEERDALLDGLLRLRSALRDLADCFSLQPRSVDIRQVLNAELSSAWVMLENCRPERMKGYGAEFDPRVRGALEEHPERLLAQIIALRTGLR